MHHTPIGSSALAVLHSMHSHAGSFRVPHNTRRLCCNHMYHRPSHHIAITGTPMIHPAAPSQPACRNKRHLQSGGSQVFSALGSRIYASERTTHVHMTSCRCERTKIACAQKVPLPRRILAHAQSTCTTWASLSSHYTIPTPTFSISCYCGEKETGEPYYEDTGGG